MKGKREQCYKCAHIRLISLLCSCSQFMSRCEQYFRIKIAFLCLGWTFWRATVSTSMHYPGRGTRGNFTQVSKTDEHLLVDQLKRQRQFCLELDCQRRSVLVELCPTPNDYDSWCDVRFAANQKRWSGMVKNCCSRNIFFIILDICVILRVYEGNPNS